mgnify:CR=1 FL=1
MELYELWKPLMRDGTASFWQEFYVKFYQAFIEGSRWKQYLNGVGTTLLVTAMALHHIPEGLTMGVGYGAVAAGSPLPSGVPLEMSSAFMVTGTTLLQNLPEGLVVATALRAEGFSAKRSWLCGVFSGCTAPIGAILGAVASQVAGSLLPFALAAAAGAMVYVVIEEVIPEANASGNGNAATVACIGGLCLVMSFSSLVG